MIPWSISGKALSSEQPGHRTLFLQGGSGTGNTSPFNRIEVDLCLIIRERDATIPFYDEPAAFRESMYSVLDSRVIQTAGLQFGYKRSYCADYLGSLGPWLVRIHWYIGFVSGYADRWCAYMRLCYLKMGKGSLGQRRRSQADL